MTWDPSMRAERTPDYGDGRIRTNPDYQRDVTDAEWIKALREHICIDDDCCGGECDACCSCGQPIPCSNSAAFSDHILAVVRANRERV